VRIADSKGGLNLNAVVVAGSFLARCGYGPALTTEWE